MAGPHIPWRAGRIDGTAVNTTPDGRLPDGAQGADHLRNVSISIHAQIPRSQFFPQVFYRMGFNDQDIVALAGAHALGRCHRDRFVRVMLPYSSSITTFVLLALDSRDHGLSLLLP